MAEMAFVSATNCTLGFGNNWNFWKQLGCSKTPLLSHYAVWTEVQLNCDDVELLKQIGSWQSPFAKSLDRNLQTFNVVRRDETSNPAQTTVRSDSGLLGCSSVSRRLHGLLYSQEKSTTVLRNVGNNFPAETALTSKKYQILNTNQISTAAKMSRLWLLVVSVTFVRRILKYRTKGLLGTSS